MMMMRRQWTSLILLLPLAALRSHRCGAFLAGGGAARRALQRKTWAGGDGGAATSELPDTYEQSLQWMSEDVLAALKDGVKLLRVDFDTSAGDETYTTLKQALPFTQSLLQTAAETAVGVGQGPEQREGEEEERTLRVFFPDQGTAALLERDWKMGTENSLVPSCVRLCGMTREVPRATDAGIIIVCPQNSEADDTLKVVGAAQEGGQFVILINPRLVNMGTTGYGLAGRRIRSEVISKFTTVFYLRTLQWGAVVRRYAREYGIWQEDALSDGGYRLLRSVMERPNMMELDEIYEQENGLAGEEGGSKFLNAFSDFVRDFGRL